MKIVFRCINKHIKSMKSDSKILSFRPSRECENTVSSKRKICQNLEEKFRDEPSGSPLKEKSKLSGCNPGVLTRMNLSNSRKAFRSGAEKITKTFRRVRTTFGTLSQHLQIGSRRRQRLTEAGSTPCHTPATPQARCRKVLGRTPTKLYSPFGIETPRYVTDSNDSHLNPDTPEHLASPRKKHKFAVHPWHFISSRPRSLFR